MLDVAKLHILTEGTVPAPAKLNCSAKVELGLQKKAGSAGGASKDLQAVLKGARQPLAELLELNLRERRRDKSDPNEGRACPHRTEQT